MRYCGGVCKGVVILKGGNFGGGGTGGWEEEHTNVLEFEKQVWGGTTCPVSSNYWGFGVDCSWRSWFDGCQG